MHVLVTHSKSQYVSCIFCRMSTEYINSYVQQSYLNVTKPVHDTGSAIKLHMGLPPCHLQRRFARNNGF